MNICSHLLLSSLNTTSILHCTVARTFMQMNIHSRLLLRENYSLLSVYWRLTYQVRWCHAFHLLTRESNSCLLSSDTFAIKNASGVQWGILHAFPIPATPAEGKPWGLWPTSHARVPHGASSPDHCPKIARKADRRGHKSEGLHSSHEQAHGHCLSGSQCLAAWIGWVVFSLHHLTSFHVLFRFCYSLAI